MTRTGFFLAFLFSFLLAFPWTATPALAKGVDSGVLTGPGLSVPLRISPDDERTAASLDLVREGSAVTVALVAELPGEFRPAPPPGDLGPRYRLAWHLPEDDSEVVQDLYPYAAGAPLVHTPAQRHVVRTGWHRAPAFLKDALVGVGLPAEPPRPWWAAWWWAAAAGLVVIVTIALSWRRLARAAGASRRPTGQTG
ncbi:hypothetical protein ACWENQ_37195 [Nonomuraea sp. NPDC004354]